MRERLRDERGVAGREREGCERCGGECAIVAAGDIGRAESGALKNY